MLPKLIPLEDDDASKELEKQFKKRGIELNLETQCDKSRTPATASASTSAARPTECDLDARRDRPRAQRRRASASRGSASSSTRKKGIAADEHRRTNVPHIYAIGDCAGYWQLAHTAFREGEVAAENAHGP